MYVCIYIPFVLLVLCSNVGSAIKKASSKKVNALI